MDDKTSHRLVLNEFTLYETKTIDRTTPTDPTELNVIDDDVIYSKQEITDILTVLDEGNRISGGLHKVVTAYGIVGFIRFTEGYYISLITEKSPVALIGGHYIYHIDNTVLRPIGPNTRVEKKSDEQSYINWWTNDALNQKDGQHDIARYQVVSRLSRQFDEEEDSDKGYWIEYYGPRSITSFEKLFAFTMNSTTKYIPTSANLSTYDYSPFTVRVNPQGTKLMNIGGLKKWLALPANKVTKGTIKSLNPSVSSSEAKEYKQYISQIKNISLTSTPTSDTDPSLTSHSEYHHYANYVKRANLPNPITDLNIPADEKVYYDYLEVPKKCAILQAAGSNHYANSGVKSRYQAYEAWLKTGKLIVSNNNSKNKINTVNSLIISGNGSGSSIIVGNKDGGLVVSSNNNSIQNRSNSNNNFDQMRKELYKINEVV
ncbi:7579_t:CDS:2 [Entrophospora sp. SA101]|nr:7579_t:CDS:2 [Entrophospora sp. SA101]